MKSRSNVRLFGSVMITAYNDRRYGILGGQTIQQFTRQSQYSVRWSHSVEEIPRMNTKIRAQLDDGIYGSGKTSQDILLTKRQAAFSPPWMILAGTQMTI
jgi:hypothetical protein